MLWHVLKRCTAEMIAAAPKLRLIQKIGVGVNTIDLDAAKARGIAVCNLPGTNARAVAELTLALMLAVLRRLPRFDAAMRAATGPIPSCRTASANSAVARSAWSATARSRACSRQCWSRWAAEVLYTSRTPGRRRHWASSCRSMRCWRRADVVSLHLPLTAETERLIDRAASAA